MRMPIILLSAATMCLMWAVAEGQQGGAPATGGGSVDQKVVVIKGVDRFRVVEPMFECVRVALSYLGEKYSPAYIQGISGAAFRISGICPCAPTVNVAMGPKDLIHMLGYTLEFLLEILSKYPAASSHLTRAAEHFAAEADALDSCEKVLGWSSPKGPDAARNARVVETLSEARRHYDLGIGEIEQALAAMGERRERPGSAGGAILGRIAYRFEWIGPGSPPLTTWDGVEVRSRDAYAHHVNPLYNIQEDLPHDPPEGDDWKRLWKELAGGLASNVEVFALVAYEGEKLAGMIRLLPKTLTRPRYGAWRPDDHQNEWTDDILWIGAAYVDDQGAADGLDSELVRRVIVHARNAGYPRIQCLGWSDVRPYAMWGQSFPATVYEKLGFRRIASVDGTHLNALPDMLAGRHSPEIQKAAKEAMAELGFTEKEANAFHIVEHECKY